MLINLYVCFTPFADATSIDEDEEEYESEDELDEERDKFANDVDDNHKVDDEDSPTT